MTMEAMVSYLKTRGFEVEKEYVKGQDAYSFVITRGDLHVRKMFPYPGKASYEERDRIQKAFLSDLVEEFEEAEKNYKESKGMTIEHMKTVLRNNGYYVYVTEVMDNIYEFTIRKGNRTLSGRYPQWDGIRDAALFVNDLMRRFEDHAYEICNPRFYEQSAWGDMARAIIKKGENKTVPEIQNVIFNEPATIVFWTDGTKTVVKCQEDDIFDPEKGLAMAISKKALGNEGNYCNEIKKWTEKYEYEDVELIYPASKLADIMKKLEKRFTNSGE